MAGFPRRRFLHLAGGVVALPTVLRAARAQAYPSRTVRVMVGFAPGGSTDIMARLMSQELSERLGQRFIVENQPGAGGNLATERVVNAPPDGYTLLAPCLANAGNVTMYHRLKFNFLRDLAPIGGIALEPYVLEVTPGFPPKTVPEFLAYAKVHPGEITMASAGVGSGNHLAGELFKLMAGVNLMHVPYRGAGPAMVDLMAGEVQVLFNTVANSRSYVSAGKIRALGVATKTPVAALPGVPTLAEFVPGYEASFWTGLAAPKGTPAEIIEELNKTMNAVLADPKLKARLDDWGDLELAGSPADFGKFIAAETEKWGKAIRAANIRAD